MTGSLYDFDRRPGKRAAGTAPRKEPNLFAGALGGGVAGLVGMGVWAVLAYGTHMEVGWVAWGIGALVGFAAWRCAGARSVALGGIAAGITFLAIMGGSYLPLRTLVRESLRSDLSMAWGGNLEFAKKACSAETDAQLRGIVAEWKATGNEGPAPDKVTEEDLREFRGKELPVMESIASGKMTRQEWIDLKFAEIWGEVSFFDVMNRSMNLFTLLWLILGTGSAIGLAAGPPERG